MDLQSLQIPEYIRSLNPYVPGKPIEETQRELGISRVIKLASNENPLGPSPAALDVIRKGLRELHRYPDASAYRLKKALSRHLKTDPSRIITGNGSNEVIDMLVRTFCQAGDAIVTSNAAFVAYRICAQIHGVRTLESPLTPDLRFDLQEMAKLAREYPRTKLIFVPNPNNPTGTYMTEAELRTFLDEVRSIRGGSVLVALDYAYWEYVTARDLPDPHVLMRDYPNVVVLRTFSKIYGLAGLRAGYGVARPEIISMLEKVRQPFNLNSLALAAAEAALGDQAFVRQARKENSDGLKFWMRELDRMEIPYWPSQGNFILADVGRGLGKRGGDVYVSCLRRGVIFRPVANYGLQDALRISIGTAKENEIAVRALAMELPPERRKRLAGAAAPKASAARAARLAKKKSSRRRSSK